MATLPQIDSGRVQLAGVPGAQLQPVNVPQINMVGTQVQAQQASTLSQLLDRMSQSAFSEAGKMQEKAGVQFAAENPPTAEQLELAKNGDMSWVGSAGSQNIFDIALRKARSLEVASHFEAEGRTELTKLLTQVETGKVTSQDVATKIRSMTDGLAKSLAPVDADAALKFRASMATYGSTVLKSAFDAEQKRAKEQRKIKFDVTYNNITRLMEETVKQGGWMDAEGQMRPVDDLANVMRDNVKNEALLLGDAALQKQYSDDFEKKFSAAKINAVSEHVADTAFAPDAMSAISNLDKGNAGKMTAVWSKMTFDEKAKVRSNLRTVQIERQTTKDQNDKDLLTTDTQRVAVLQSEFFKSGSKAALDELRAISIRSPKAISPESVFDLPKKRSEGEIANPRAEFVIKTEIMQGLHPDAASIERRSKELGIGYKRLSDAVLPFLITRGNDEERDIERMFRTESKIVPGQFNISQRQNSAYAKLTTDFAREYPQRVAQAQADKKPVPTRIQVAKDLLAVRQTSEQTKAIKNNLEALNNQFGVSGTLRKTGIVFTDESDYNEIASQAKKLNLTGDDLRSIEQRMKIIKQQREALDAQ
jgi:hypothetical protein